MPETPVTEKPAGLSRVEMTQLVLPSDTNALGTAFGGTVMGWTDICAAIAAQRHSGKQVVTVAVDQLTFVEPIKLGMVVSLKAQVNMAFHTSMEVGVRVESENARTGERRHALTAYLTFVALDDAGCPTSVPRAVAVTEDEKRRQREAVARREARLALRRSLGR
ncbi:MAG: acyl-CoA thioesterase [Myxococcota bacterium]